MAVWALASVCATLLFFSASANAATQSYGFSDNVWGNPDISHSVALSGFAAAKAKYVRTPVNWQYYEPTEGAYSHDYLAYLYDEYTQMRANGQTPVFVLMGTPYWALGAAGRGAGNMISLCADNNNATQCFAPPNVRDETIKAHWRTFAATLAYIMPNAVFEIWNEPNISWFWLQPQDPQLYGLVLKSASEGIRMGSPTAKVLSGSINNYAGPNTASDTNYTSFLKQMYPAAGAKSFDALGFHTYPCNNTTANAIGWTRVPNTDLAAVRNARNAAGDSKKPLWLTETGATTGSSDDAHCGTHFTEAQQGLAIESVLSWAKSQNNYKGDLPVVLVYSLFNAQPRSVLSTPSIYGQDEFGLKAYTRSSTGAVTIADKPGYAIVACKFAGTC